MRWKLFYCILLTSTVFTSANERPKRSLGYIKKLIGNKLFGALSTPTNSVVIAQLISKNNTHQLFNIPGQNFNLLIQVANQNNKTDDKGLAAIKIVSPEIAILGTYLGTKTQDETLLAIEMAKSMVKSGVLQGYKDNAFQKVVVEMKENFKPLNIYSQERDPLYIYPGAKRVELKNPVYPVELPPVGLPLPPKYPVDLPPVAIPLPPRYPVVLPPVAQPLQPNYPLPLPPRFPVGLPPVEVKKPVPVYPVELPPVAVPLPSGYSGKLPPARLPLPPRCLVDIPKPLSVSVELPPVQELFPINYPIELPPLFVGSEIAVPFPPMYSYIQYGNNPMKYESYNGKDVIVTHTSKQPIIPDPLKYRIKEVAAIAVNPFMKLPVAGVPPMPVNIAPIPYQGRPPGTVNTIDEPFKVHINTQPILFPEPVPLQQAVNFSPIQHAIINTKGAVKVTSNAHSVNTNFGGVKLENNVDKVDIKYGNNKGVAVSNSGNPASSYVYKQVNSQNPLLSTEIRVENQPNVNGPASINSGDLSKNFVYMPPKDLIVPPPIGLSSQPPTNLNDHVYTSKTIPYVPMPLSVKTNGYLKSNPIVVSDNFGAENRESNTVIEENNHTEKELESTRGDIPGSIH